MVTSFCLVEAIDRLHTTAETHNRVMVLEVMGRYAGWIALESAIAGGGDVALVPEIPYDIDKVIEIEGNDAKMFKNGKAKLKPWLTYAKKFGTTCKGV